MGGINARLETIVIANPVECVDKFEDVLAKAMTAFDEFTNKNPPDNEAALGNIEGAVGDLEATFNDNECSNPGKLTNLMKDLAGIAREVVNQAIEEASGDTTDAEAARDAGNDHRTADEYKDAVSKYKDALSKLP